MIIDMYFYMECIHMRFDLLHFVLFAVAALFVFFVLLATIFFYNSWLPPIPVLIVMLFAICLLCVTFQNTCSHHVYVAIVIFITQVILCTFKFRSWYK